MSAHALTGLLLKDGLRHECSMLLGIENQPAARNPLEASAFVGRVARIGVRTFQTRDRVLGLVEAHTRTMRDVGHGGELYEALLIHRRNKGEPDDPCWRRFEPNRGIENLGEQFIIHARQTCVT